jgi:tRNA(His) 5'-end guanylyltransferase
MDLEDRMIGYQEVSNFKLMNKTPVILRLDGRSFHSVTKTLKAGKPFDEQFQGYMTETLKALMSKVQGAIIGYTQSDEISLCLWDWETFETQPWFQNRVQKLCSVSASIATCAFIRELSLSAQISIDIEFDCRAFNVPIREVCNYFVWRQQDSIRNYWQGMGQYHIGKKQIHGMSNEEIRGRLKHLDHNDKYRLGPTIINKDKVSIPQPVVFSESQDLVKELLKGQE